MDKKIALIVIIIILVAGFFLFVKNQSSVSGSVIQTEYVENLHETTLKIDNMYCEACAYNADINYKDASGIVIYNADIINPSTIAAASTVYPATTVNDKKL